jgi:hydroxyacylglutathione hydrolase/adenylyltransferase/sulfurtransferase
MTEPRSAADLEVSTDQTAHALADGSAQVVDVREAYEREAGHIAGTDHIELGQLASSAETLDRDRPVIFACRAGSRSLMAAQAFRRAGFDAYSMAGGLSRWADEGRPLAPDDGYVADH